MMTEKLVTGTKSIKSLAYSHLPWESGEQEAK